MLDYSGGQRSVERVHESCARRSTASLASHGVVRVCACELVLVCVVRIYFFLFGLLLSR